MQVNLYDAKAQLSQLVERAMAGEDVVIAKAGKPMVKLIPVRDSTKRVFGTARGKFDLPEDWDRAMTDEEVDEFINHGAL